MGNDKYQMHHMILKLPLELHYRIYNLDRIEELQTPINNRRSPGLLATRQQIKSVFASVYYTPDLWHIELYLRGKFFETWQQVTTSASRRVLLELFRRAVASYKLIWTIMNATSHQDQFLIFALEL